MTANYIYKYYPLTHVLHNEKSSTERIWKAISIVHPDVPDCVSPIKMMKPLIMMQPQKIYELQTFGAYVLYDGTTILAVAIINRNRVNNVITIPRFRRQGHAFRLLKHLEITMKRNLMPIVAPVEAEVEPLFFKLGWVRDPTKCKDGTYEFHLAEHREYYRMMCRGDRPDMTKWIEYLQTVMVNA
jgi:hypothetical protein